MEKIAHLDIFIGAMHAGVITLLPHDRAIFSFTDAYTQSSERPILSLSYLDIYGEPLTDRNVTQTKLEPFFSNLLPEGHLRSYLTERAGIKDVREFNLLWILGRDVSGNVSIRPAGGEDWPPNEDKTLSKAEAARKQQQAMRFSLAGVQLKFSALQGASGGLTIPARGDGGSWIVKLPSGRWRGVPENEYAMMSLARTMGMNVPEVSLVDMKDIGGIPEGIGDMVGKALAVKRFDRLDGGGRVHIEDFAQIFGLYPEEKYTKGNYKNIAEVLWARAGEGAIEEFVRRLVFNALIGNGDMHMKNWSLIYPDGLSSNIAPAYDFLSTLPYMSDTGMALNLYRRGPKKFTDLTTQSFIKFAAEARLPETMVINTARETVEKFHDLWGEAKKSLPIAQNISAAIEAHVKTIPIAN